MVTKKKLLIYKKHEGDIDDWARFGSIDEKEIMSDDDWYLIDSLIQDIIITRNQLKEKLRKKTETEELIKELLTMANDFGSFQ